MSKECSFGEVRQVLVTDIKPGPNVRLNPREDELTALGESLKGRQWHPVILDPDLCLLDGWRRWLAAQKAGIKVLWAVVTDRRLSAQELKLAQMAMSLHRADLTDYEKWKNCCELMMANPSYTQKDLAGLLHVDEGRICKWLSPSRAIDEAQRALEQGLIGLSAVYVISKAPKEQQPELLQAKLAGASRDDVDRKVRAAKRRNSPAVRVAVVRCPLASGVTVSIAGASVSLDDVIDALGDARKAAMKARDESLDAKTWQAVMRDKAKIGGAL